MKIQDSYEYRLVKELTKDENKVAVRKTLLLGTTLFGFGMMGIFGFIHILGWLLKL